MGDKTKSINAYIDDDELVLLFYKVAVSTRSSSFSGANLPKLHMLEKGIGFSVQFVNLSKRLLAHQIANHFVVGYHKKPTNHLWLFIHHLRNAFCHNNVKKNADGTYTLKDYWFDKDANRQKLTMFANIDTGKLRNLLTELEKLKK